MQYIFLHYALHNYMFTFIGLRMRLWSGPFTGRWVLGSGCGVTSICFCSCLSPEIPFQDLESHPLKSFCEEMDLPWFVEDGSAPLDFSVRLCNQHNGCCWTAMSSFGQDTILWSASGLAWQPWKLSNAAGIASAGSSPARSTASISLQPKWWVSRRPADRLWRSLLLRQSHTWNANL